MTQPPTFRNNIMNLHTATIMHDINKANEKHNFIKHADKNFKVKVIFKEGIYDNELVIQGFKEDVSAFIGWFKTKDINNTPKTLTRNFPTSK